MRALALVLAVALCGCPSEATFVEPGTHTTGPDTTGGKHSGDTTGVVQRAQLVVIVTVHGADSALAARLGGAPGVLPKALVTVQRQSSNAKQVDTTDANGRAVFTGLTPGPSANYAVSVALLLSNAETATFDSADHDVNAFGGGTVVGRLVAPGDSVTVVAAAGRRGSLVISEVYQGDPVVNGIGYPYASFIEVYNNSDTTIYLDGKILGTGPEFIMRGSTTPGFYTCDDTRTWRLDSEGIWSFFLWQFPGSGHDHPLAPGRAAVIAEDAVNHSVVAPGLPDLSASEFEFIGSQDADNPAAANMINATPVEFLASLGHGFTAAFYYDWALFIADSADVASLPVVRLNVPHAPNPPTLYRVPRAKILDVFASFLTPDGELNEPTFPPCPDAILPVYDKQPGALLLWSSTTSTIARLVLGMLPDGRSILQRTGATANDFVSSTLATPGYVR